SRCLKVAREACDARAMRRASHHKRISIYRRPRRLPVAPSHAQDPLDATALSPFRRRRAGFFSERRSFPAGGRGGLLVHGADLVDDTTELVVRRVLGGALRTAVDEVLSDRS